MSTLNQFYVEGINPSLRIIKHYQKGKTAAEIAAT